MSSRLVDEVVDHLVHGRFEQIRELFLPPLRALVSASAMVAAWREAVGEHPGTVVLEGTSAESASRPWRGRRR